MRHGTDAAEPAPSPFLNAVRWAPRSGPLERLAQVLCQVALAAMMLMVAAEVATRALTGRSLEVTDEVGGYLLVALTFVSMPVCLVEQSFHRVEFIQARLPERARACCELFFDVVSFACAALILWQVWRLQASTWRSDDLAPTSLMTPLWLPRASMVLGFAILCLTLVRFVLRDVRRIAAAGRPPP